MQKEQVELDPESPEISHRDQVILLVTTAAGHAIKHAYNAAFFLLLPEIKASLILSNSQVGLLSSIRLALGGLGNIPAGYVGDRYRKQRAGVLSTTLIMVGAFSCLLGMVTGYWMAVIAAALGNLAITFWHPTAISSLARQFSSRRGFAISLHGTGGSVGEALGPLIAGALLAVFSWRVILQGSIIPALIFGLLIWVLLKIVPTQSGGVPNFRIYVQGLWGLFRNRRLLIVLLLTGAFAGGQGTVLTFFPVYLREDLGYSSFSTSVFLFLAQVAGIAVQPVMGYASDRFGRKAVMVPSLLILGTADAALSVVPDGIPLILTVIVMGAFLFSLMSIFLAAASDLVGANAQATIVSLVFGAAVAVAGILPTIAGSLADIFGNLQVAFVCAGVVVLGAGLLGIVLKWQPSD